ncbi:MAG: tRNA (guanosine(37)-N1)-methyltransferase TrmD [Candidatus Planktophila sp.]|jgi:tRNA (guanine37-N1)-methyltransferase|nr:tRNA (guanosine(37)-N1)-methyltransferase TrmD [Candidatus Planktophila sp.]
MRIDAVTIFPDYFAPMQLSLLGKAQGQGILEINIHDLRSFTTDNHHTVDDTPYGGGAGMVMLPEVWGLAIDSVIADGATLIVLTPAGKRFTQEMAHELTTAKQLIFACGRYEGIDDRVRQHYSSEQYSARGIKVLEVSIGDYVLGGGEVASMVMIEAITRLLPGVLGNPESLVEESHKSEGYLEYPNFTKPQSWRDIAVPEILLSGNHAQIAKWRATQAELRAKKNL